MKRGTITLTRQKTREYKARWIGQISATVVFLLIVLLVRDLRIALILLFLILIIWLFFAGLVLPVRVTIDSKGIHILVSKKETYLPWDLVKGVENQKERYATVVLRALGYEGKETTEVVITTRKEFELMTPNLPNVEKSGFVFPKGLTLSTSYFLPEDLEEAFLVATGYSEQHQFDVKDNLNWI
jgi:hypothetical protein